MNPALGVCYYPEHWPEENWEDDARRMVEAGLSWVRIGEFAWSGLEPTPGRLQFEWLDRAINVLGQAGLKVVLGTPTATPPRWMLDKYPDMLAHDEAGRPRKFGSRRHYCFSHSPYLEECRRIADILGARYGANPHVAAWQIDNEYGCHDTILSYSPAAVAAFRGWLKQQYKSVEVLNRAWGNVFWSMEYQDFAQIDLPNLTVTEPNPAHVWAFRRFCSDQVVTFNKAQVDVLKRHTDRPLVHNYMGRVHEFDHFDVGADLDIASWDSYPIGFLSDRLEASEAHKLEYLRQGDPDMQAFHHDLYRAVGSGRWWIMEQQPGPVNWAPHNPAPLPGMVRLWTLEAIAHGAEVVTYFRWRQAPFAQEQMHAGLLTSEGEDAVGLEEAASVARTLDEVGEIHTDRAPVALVFDYPSQWAWEALPQGKGFDYFAVMLDTYRALRRAGLSVDFVQNANPDLTGYKLVLAPGLAVVSEALQKQLDTFEGLAVLGPRTGAITKEFSLPPNGRPAISGLDARIEYVETLPPGAPREVVGGGAIQTWSEKLRPDQTALLKSDGGDPVLIENGNLWYLSGLPDEQLWDRIIKMAGERQGLETFDLPKGLRRREAGARVFWINYNAKDVEWNGESFSACGVVIE